MHQTAGRQPRLQDPHFTVVTLPAYKAELTLERTVNDLPPDTADHLLLVDDCSPDGTVELARDLGIDVRVHDRNRGYGANQKTCYREALGLGPRLSFFSTRTISTIPWRCRR